MEKMKLDLERIEQETRHIRSDFWRYNEMFIIIAGNINDSVGDERSYWDGVMSLFKDKYRD